jgi:pimeloyl-ACP methyl ester carboxylesterase
MRSKLKWFVPLLFFIGLAIMYLRPAPVALFDELYAKVEPSIVDSLQSFRQANPPRHLQDGGVDWEYIAVGEGKETIVFLHGMAGAYDIWWQQIDALKEQYRIISVTYPPVQSLAALEKGVLAILENEDVKEFNAVGTSMGGYLAQYLIVKHPKRVRRAVLSNTFPPNDLIAEKNRTLGSLLPLLPEWLVISVFRGNFRKTIYPASGNDELTLAFLNEIGYGRMSKAHLIGRYHCVIEKFSIAAPAVPVMIIESDNDPLVEPVLREQLKAAYPNAVVHTFSGAGHFSYLNRPQEYTRLLADFLSNKKMGSSLPLTYKK